MTRLLKDEYKATNEKVRQAYREKKRLQEQAVSRKIKKKRNKNAEKHFICEVADCQKEYCSIDALALHVKRKHPELVNKFCIKRKSIQDAVDEKVKSLNCFAKSVRRTRVKYDYKLETKEEKTDSERAMSITGHSKAESTFNHHDGHSSHIDELEMDCMSLCKGNEDHNTLPSPGFDTRKDQIDGTFGDLEGLPFI